VADLAEAAAWRMGLEADTITFLRRAALAQDLGRVGVSNAIWEKPAALGFGEWERVRLHAHYSERAFAQSPELAAVGRLAGSHHERLDGSGYRRGARDRRSINPPASWPPPTVMPRCASPAPTARLSTPGQRRLSS
jgi:HD-GYP domain-containing protein (c-di-GMP phosphodiesterase class II)